MKSHAQTILRLLVIVLLMCSVRANDVAATPEDYRKRVESARFSAGQLLSRLDELATEQERELVTEIEREIPANETIEWSGGSVVTENGWLAEKLKAFTDEADRSKRAAILAGISERLLAISESAGELQKAVAADRSKDQDKQKLAEILRREEYQKPQVKEESLFAKWWREFMEWLARVFPRPESTPNVPSGFGSLQFVLQIVLYVLVIGLVGFFIYKFAPLLFRRFSGKARDKKEDRVILGERIGADESALDLFSEAEQLARDGNLRGAIRKGYVAFLCDLSDRKIVRLARHKTNRDYLKDVRKDDTLFENMTGLTRNFETNWYGLRAAEQGDWEDFRSLYKQAIGSMSSKVR